MEVDEMGEYEDKVRAAIKEKYGSVPKMAETVGIAPTTIYHALERGIENTRTETSRKILDALFDDFVSSLFPTVAARVRLVENADEAELLALFRSMDESGRERLIEQAAFLAKRHPMR